MNHSRCPKPGELRTIAAVCVVSLLIVAGVSRAQGRSASDTILAAAQWIADSSAIQGDSATSAFPLLRKRFALSSSSPVVRATFIATALGSYQATLNGSPVGNGVLTPVWTDYRHRVYYQTYDVTGLVRPGPNALGVMLGEGWFGSPMVSTGSYGYGNPPVRFLGVLQIVHADGHVDVIASDSTWRSTRGPVLESQIYAGETYDARRLPVGWDKPDFDDHAWPHVGVLAAPADLAIVPQTAPLVERVATLIPRRHFARTADTVLYDLGQNMVGWARIRVHGPAGGTVQLRHAEVLQADSQHLRTQNLGAAAATDLYTLSGRGNEHYEPHFTYHGFRYVQVVTSRGVHVDSLTGVVVHTNARETATFESSDSTVNRLWKNTLWSLRGNLVGIPTDCPQRSERLGWMGDAAAFWPTGVYLMDLRTLTRDWLADLRDSQSDNPQGCFPSVSPTGKDCGGPGWSDAGVLVPYASYRQYGDTAVVRTHWASMERYMDYIAKNNPTFRWEEQAHGYGDWAAASADERTGATLIGTVFWAEDARAMRDMARGLGDGAAAERYGQLYDRIRAAFAQRYIAPNGTVGEQGDNGIWETSQSSDALALRAGLVPDSLRGKVIDHLVADVAAHGGHLTTGFVGTPPLLPALSDQGRDDVAYGLLLIKTYPSWLFNIAHGATTMWEYWNGVQDADHISFNHYLYGSVSEWLIRYAAGIDQDSGSVAFQHIVIRPHPDPMGRIKHLTMTYDSPVGRIESGWSVAPASGVVTLTGTIPTQSTAEVDVPVRDGKGYRYVAHTVHGGPYRFVGDGQNGG